MSNILDSIKHLISNKTKWTKRDDRKFKRFKQEYVDTPECPNCSHIMTKLPDISSTKFVYMQDGIVRKLYSQYLCLYCKDREHSHLCVKCMKDLKEVN